MAVDLVALLEKRARRARYEAERPPPGPKGWCVALPRDDALEECGPVRLGAAQVLIGHCIGLDYVDADGRESRRRVTVRAVQAGRDGDLRLCAWCHERRAPRRFLASRVNSFIDLKTGEVFGNVEEFLRVLAPLGNALRADQLAGRAIQACGADLTALVFIARCDGLHDSEADVLAEFVERFPHGLPDLTRRDLLPQIARLQPDRLLFRRACGTLGNEATGEPMRRIGWALRKLVDADGELSAEEFDFVREMEEALGH